MEQLGFLNQYEEQLRQNLLRSCTSKEYLSGVMLQTPDIDDKWREMAPSYVADAIKEIVQYPTVSLGWAMYMGMAVASMWDTDWARYDAVENIYEYVRDIRGFDYLDEVVRGQILGLEGDDFKRAEELVLSCAEMSLDAIRHEQVEPQSPLALHVYARSIKVLYQIGAAVWLNQLGYKLTEGMSCN
ncbi:MAG: hypothetical protein MJZ13_09055 [Bacteroidales bacterium]|nr:hypothetical protein [Bacteroidales bacterium]